MVEEWKASLFESFGELVDPRTRCCPHPLDELLLVAICAITSGAEGWVAVTDWGRIKLTWLKQFLPFSTGIASHDTFSRVFGLLDAEVFECCFIKWMQDLCPSLEGQVIPIDGKSVRRSHNGEKRMVHLVSAWGTAAGMALGQVATADKSNEITAIPELLDALRIEGATITIDAMGCQHAIIEKIVEKKADYLIAVKDNQPTLSEALQEWFASADKGELDRPFWENIDTDKGHGRLETRRCVVTDDVAWLSDIGQSWSGLKSIVMVESTREMINGKHKGECSTERRYYISSLPAKAAMLNQRVRAHWGIENSLHWVLDVAFGEDDCRVRVGDGAQNFAILRRISLNLLKQDQSTKMGIAGKRLKAGWDTNYLESLLNLRRSAVG
jgi:predicted transposase YbfD/YdcC